MRPTVSRTLYGARYTCRLHRIAFSRYMQRDLGLNDTQGRAARAVQHNYVQLIFGPPGTGKTTTVVAIIAALVQMAPAVEGIDNGHVLVTAATHVAADRLLHKLFPHLEHMHRDGELRGIGGLDSLDVIVG
eukprot:6133161-Pyramimonas_sp.AAC.1